MSYIKFVSLFQFLVDYKLYGMSYLHLRDVKFRHIGQENSDPLTCYCRWRYNSMEATVSSVLRYDNMTYDLVLCYVYHVV